MALTHQVTSHRFDEEWVGRRVLITGGTSGTGLRAAVLLASRGASVMINGRDRLRGKDALRLLQTTGGPEGGLATGDCAIYHESARVVEEAVSALGGLDVLISAGASGTGDPKPFARMTPPEISDGLTTRFLARVQPVHAAIPHLRAGGTPSIVLLTTDAGRHATRGESIIGAYAASIIQFTKTLARELSEDRVRVNAVSMTLTSDTQSWNSIFASESYQRDLFAKALRRFPFGAAPNADDVADVAVFLASRRARQVTGQTVSVNGGLSFGGW